MYDYKLISRNLSTKEITERRLFFIRLGDYIENLNGCYLINLKGLLSFELFDG